MNTNVKTNDPDSETNHVTEQMKDISAPVPLTRDQRRLLDHLQNKFDICDEAAFARARGFKRKLRNPASTQPTPSKIAKSDSEVPAKTETPTDCEGEAERSSATKSTTQKEETERADCAPKVLSNSTNKHNGRKPTTTMAEALKCERLAIIGKTAFTSEERDRIKDAICEVVLQNETDSPPEFHGVMTKYGYLVATVADSESAQWLLKHQAEIAVESNCPLEIMREDLVPIRKLYRAIFSHSSTRSTAEIFYTLDSFNRGTSFSTGSWELIRRIDDGPTAILYIYVDGKSAEYIKCRNHAIPFRLGHAKFYPEWNKDKKQAGGADME